MGNSLILTATVNGPGVTGASLVWAGTTSIAPGARVAAGNAVAAAALFPEGVSLWPGGNSFNWARNGGLQCGR